MDIHGVQFGIRCDSTGKNQQKLLLTKSMIHQVAGDALQLTACKAIVGNSQISNAGYNCVNLIGGHYEFTHCTLANFFSWNVKRGAALQFANEQNAEPYPLHLASFRNCLITGSSSDELYGSRSANEETSFNYYFSHCLINSIKEENEQINQVIWQKEESFQLMDSRTQEYSFMLESSSTAINIGNRDDAAYYPYDLNGNPRLTDEAPDAGCYEWTSQDDTFE